MLKILLALPPIISTVHIFLAIILFLLDVQYSGNLLFLFGLPVSIVIFIHIYIAMTDNSMTKSEHIGYGLVHIPLSITFSFLTLLFFIPKDNGQVDVPSHSKEMLLQCVDKSEVECMNKFYFRANSNRANNST